MRIANVSAQTDFRGEEFRRRVSRLRCFWDAGTGSQERHPLGGWCCHLLSVAGKTTGPGPSSRSGGSQVLGCGSEPRKVGLGPPGACSLVGTAVQNLHLLRGSPPGSGASITFHNHLTTEVLGVCTYLNTNTEWEERGGDSQILGFTSSDYRGFILVSIANRDQIKYFSKQGAQVSSWALLTLWGAGQHSWPPPLDARHTAVKVTTDIPSQQPGDCTGIETLAMGNYLCYWGQMPFPARKSSTLLMPVASLESLVLLPVRSPPSGPG